MVRIIIGTSVFALLAGCAHVPTVQEVEAKHQELKGLVAQLRIEAAQAERERIKLDCDADRQKQKDGVMASLRAAETKDAPFEITSIPPLTSYCRSKASEDAEVASRVDDLLK